MRKCPYCDFGTYAIAKGEVPHRAYADAVLRELDRRASALRGRRLVSVFFGGGTPSIWRASELARVLQAVRGAFDDEAADLEVTVECNPSSFDKDKAHALVDAGVGRVSLGVQSLHDDRLRFLGRLHDSGEALRALSAAVAVVPRVSADLMFGMHGQTPAEVDQEVDQLVSHGVHHASAYALTIEPLTLFGQRHARGELHVASDSLTAALFEGVRSAFQQRGLDHYEVSNYARAGQEARHNLHYWHAGAYLGLGAGAVGCLERGVGEGRRWKNVADPRAYIDASTERATEGFSEDLDAETLIREGLMLGLRTRDGVDLAALEARVGAAARQGRARVIDRLIARGDLRQEDARIWVPLEQWIRLDGIIADLF